jgi:transcriptional regulator with XRE-family HTH domain
MKAKRQKGRGTTLEELLREEMKDPEFRRLYHEADIELRVALEITKAREAKKMTQQELAAALKTKQQTISRIERGDQNVTIGTLDRIARALGRGLQVRFGAAGGWTIGMRAYKDDRPDLRAAQKAWASHSRVSEKAVPARRYFAKRAKKHP